MVRLAEGLHEIREGWSPTAEEPERSVPVEGFGLAADKLFKAFADLGDESGPAHDVEGLFEGFQVVQPQHDRRGPGRVW